MIILAIVIGWLALATIVGTVMGRAIKRANERP